MGKRYRWAATLWLPAMLITGCSSSTGGSGNVSTRHATDATSGSGATLGRSPTPSPTVTSTSTGQQLPRGVGGLEVRALVAPAAAAGDGSAPLPLSALSFPVPDSEEQYGRLSATEQQALQAALARTRCSSPTNGGKYRVVCQGPPTTKPTLALLTGPAIVTGRDVTAARPVPPSAGGTPEWGVQVTFTSAGRTAWARYTSAHNLNGSAASASVLSCGLTGVPCTDFAAFIIGNVAVSVPATLSAVPAGVLSMIGSFTELEAQQLARQIKP
jgi:preprotein translocase subunit SecD